MRHLVLTGLKALALASFLSAVGLATAWAGSDAETEEGSESGTAKGIYVTLDPLIVPVIADGVVRRHITLQLQLEMKDLESDRRLHVHYPRVVDAFFGELYALLSMRYVREKGIDVEFFRQRLQLRADSMLGKGAVKNIIVQGIEQRRPVRTRS